MGHNLRENYELLQVIHYMPTNRPQTMDWQKSFSCLWNIRHWTTHQHVTGKLFHMLLQIENDGEKLLKRQLPEVPLDTTRNNDAGVVGQQGFFCPGNFVEGRPSYEQNPPIQSLKNRRRIDVLKKKTICCW